MKNIFKNFLVLMFLLISMNPKLLKFDSFQINPIYIAAEKLVQSIRGWQTFDDATLDQQHVFKNKIQKLKQLEGVILRMSPFRLQLGIFDYLDCHAKRQTIASTHLFDDIGSQASRHLRDSPSTIGVYS